MGNKLKSVFGMAMALFGVLGFVGFATKENALADPGAYMGLVILATLLGVGGYIVRGSLPKKVDREQAIFAVARKRDGRLTVAELALELQCDSAEAEKLLDGLVNAGAASLEVGATGMVIYEFPGLAVQQAVDPAGDDVRNQQARRDVQRNL